MTASTRIGFGVDTLLTKIIPGGIVLSFFSIAVIISLILTGESIDTMIDPRIVILGILVFSLVFGEILDTVRRTFHPIPFPFKRAIQEFTGDKRFAPFPRKIQYNAVRLLEKSFDSIPSRNIQLVILNFRSGLLNLLEQLENELNIFQIPDYKIIYRDTSKEEEILKDFENNANIDYGNVTSTFIYNCFTSYCDSNLTSKTVQRRQVMVSFNNTIIGSLVILYLAGARLLTAYFSGSEPGLVTLFVGAFGILLGISMLYIGILFTSIIESSYYNSLLSDYYISRINEEVDGSIKNTPYRGIQ